MPSILQTLLVNSFREPRIYIIISPLLSPPDDLKATIKRASNSSNATVIGVGSMYGGIGGNGGQGLNGNGGNGGTGQGPSLVTINAGIARIAIADPSLLDPLCPWIPGARWPDVIIASKSPDDDNDVRDFPGGARLIFLTSSFKRCWRRGGLQGCPSESLMAVSVVVILFSKDFSKAAWQAS
ncbi:hypothetical protein B0H17DRAFT_1146142 [Mycena rosella]|uniref:Uncharacterized protein n=1 Tax=Mycena rosella TaxID=1033263 RepID=A0AAD7CPH2_MYCRO|nr:hypothetical protein B0H17DRAFT_1146142 [Mycena rosella]